MYDVTLRGNWVKVPDEYFRQKPLHLAVLSAIRKHFGYEVKAHQFGENVNQIENSMVNLWNTGVVNPKAVFDGG